MIDISDTGLIGARDRPVMLLGFAGAFRRSELVGLDVEDCVFGRDGLTITLRRSKTDQEGQGRKLGIPYGSNPDTCPVRVVQAWLEQSDITAAYYLPATQESYTETGLSTLRTEAKPRREWHERIRAVKGKLKCYLHQLESEKQRRERP